MFFGWLPNWIVLELIQRYELKEIKLIQDETYQKYKHDLLKKKFIKLKDFREFVKNTKGDKYTKFEIIPPKFPIKSKKRVLPIVNYDIKFNQYLYIQFSVFNEFSSKEIQKILKEEKETKFLILDLRNNGGGYLESCIKISQNLIAGCEILKLRYKDRTTSFIADSNSINFERIFIFVDENSISCSEILSMTLKKHLNNVVLVGNCTFGKDTTQHTIINDTYNFTFSISDAKWYIEEETVIQLQKYIQQDNVLNQKFNNDDSFFKFVLDYQKNLKNTIPQ